MGQVTGASTIVTLRSIFAYGPVRWVTPMGPSGPIDSIFWRNDPRLRPSGDLDAHPQFPVMLGDAR